MFEITSHLIENNFVYFDLIYFTENSIIIPISFYAPHILPKFIGKPIRIYKPKLNRNLIGVENRKRTVIYQ